MTGPVIFPTGATCGPASCLTPAPCTHQRFTLLEVTIAVLILSITTTLLLLGANTVMSSWENLNRHADNFDRILVLDRTLDRLLTNTVPFTWPDDDFKEVLLFQGGDDYMIISVVHRLNRMDEGALRFCGFFLEEDELVVYSCNRPPFPEDLNSDRLTRTVIARHVNAVEFFYANISDETVEMVSEWDNPNAIPIGIMVAIEWEDGTQHSWLRRTSGSSYHERWGRPRRQPFTGI